MRPCQNSTLLVEKAAFRKTQIKIETCHNDVNANHFTIHVAPTKHWDTCNSNPGVGRFPFFSPFLLHLNVC